MTLEKLREAIIICCTLDPGGDSSCCDCPYFNNDNCLEDLMADMDKAFIELIILRSNNKKPATTVDVNKSMKGLSKGSKDDRN